MAAPYCLHEGYHMCRSGCLPLLVFVHAVHRHHYTSHCFFGASGRQSVLLYRPPHLLYSYA